MYILAGFIKLDVVVVHRTIHLTLTDAFKARTTDALKGYTFLKPRTLVEIAEIVKKAGVENVLLVPIDDCVEEK